MNAIDILALTATHPDEWANDGVRLLSDGVRSQALFVLVDGELEVQRRGRAVVRVTDPGAIVGELGFLLDSPASADVITVGPTVVRRIDDPASLFDLSPDFGRHLATVLARRLWQMSTYLSDLQEQFADQGEVLSLVPQVLDELLGSSRPSPDPGSERETESPY
ncbi:MAG TPA: cyclic nucleotide-binding domain-containing protein [Ilumatobacter sp.]|nr:cyclic nucleotide-binding domain-containing protein [Ilumatobacter sp.]